MRTNILNILRELRTVSSGAGAISDRVLAKIQRPMVATASDEVAAEADLESTVQALRAKVKDMESKIEELGEALEEAHDVQMTDAGRAQYKTAFLNSNAGLPATMLYEAYGPAYFNGLPRTLCGLSATVLMDISSLRRLKPLPIWESIYSKSGDL